MVKYLQNKNKSTLHANNFHLTHRVWLQVLKTLLRIITPICVKVHYVLTRFKMKLGKFTKVEIVNPLVKKDKLLQTGEFINN